MHILERAAIEGIAIKLFEHYNAKISNIYTWKGVSEETRNSWRKHAELMLGERYYTDGR